MRFYTGKLEGTQLLFAGFEKDPFLYRIEDYGMKFSDMTELVCTITDEQKDRLLNEREGKRAYALDEIQILPPIVQHQRRRTGISHFPRLFECKFSTTYI